MERYNLRTNKSRTLTKRTIFSVQKNLSTEKLMTKNFKDFSYQIFSVQVKYRTDNLIKDNIIFYIINMYFNSITTNFI